MSIQSKQFDLLRRQNDHVGPVRRRLFKKQPVAFDIFKNMDQVAIKKIESVITDVNNIGKIRSFTGLNEERGTSEIEKKFLLNIKPQGKNQNSDNDAE